MVENHPNEIHIGQCIQEQLKADQRSVSWLASQIPCTRNHLYKIFKKDSIDCALLLRISQIIDADMIYALQIGRVEESGDPDEIYKKGGIYKDIIDASARSLNIEKIARTIGDERG